MRASELTEMTAFHGSFRPRIEKFKPLSHFGSEQAALERLKAINKNQSAGYLYKLDLGIHHPAKVKDYYQLQDPNPNNVGKISAWVDDILKDPRVKQYKYTWTGPNGNTEIRTGTDKLKYIKGMITKGWWSEYYSYVQFITLFTETLRDMGIDGLVYKNVVEHANELSYVALDFNNVRVIGKAKQIQL